MDPWIVHRNDSAPNLYFQCIDQDLGHYISLVNATSHAFAKLRERNGSENLSIHSTFFGGLTKMDSGLYGWVRFDLDSDVLTGLEQGRYELEVSTGTVAFSTAVTGLRCGIATDLSVTMTTDIYDATGTLLVADDASTCTSLEFTGGDWEVANTSQAEFTTTTTLQSGDVPIHKFAFADAHGKVVAVVKATTSTARFALDIVSEPAVVAGAPWYGKISTGTPTGGGPSSVLMRIYVGSSIITANRYYWDGECTDDATIFPIKVKEDF